MDKTTYSIGSFAKLTGIPVRTLHYYDQMGLVSPRRQESGHRIYGTDDLITLQKVIGLKSLGFSLERIRQFIQHPESDISLADTLTMQRQAMEAARAELDRSLDMLGRMEAILQHDGKLHHEMMFLLIRNMTREDKQRKWVAEHLSEPTAKALFDLPKDAIAELDREVIAFVQAVKRLSIGASDAAEAELMLDHYVRRVLGFLDDEALASMAHIPEEQHEQLNLLVDMPFDARETAWLEEALAHYVSKYGLHGMDNRRGRFDEAGSRSD